MASTSVFLPSFDPFPKTRATIKPSSSSTRGTGLTVRATRRESRNHNPRGRIVDESMIVLRKRIHEMKMIEADSELPSEWMDWEKRVYSSYDAIICDAMGHLQSYLMGTRPSLTLGMVVLIALSVPTSTAVVVHNLIGFSNVIFSGIHLG
ncbi:mediator of RNA polymerase II transcription subunit [Perilla frutescens var. hirtella]|uniref:Mediator of RNA polymerase II transcription subunit n=1 Tax=Perilla frutescens var. hirtella TaxID=608512 RepID=A0AAD4J750_PERFH|nr:mediator of RNA polymerase II transcription subunit [Perilla frutescens var. hirtella]